MPTVTGKVYNHSKRMKEKRAVLYGVAAELQRIVGKPVGHAETALRPVAGDHNKFFTATCDFT